MPPVIPNPDSIHAFATAAAFERWLRANHAKADEVWVKFHKKASGLKTVTYAEALDVALCWGWIDGLKKSFDEKSFLQRFSPRKSRSIWSKINTAHVERLIAANRMQPSGQKHIDAAKADGRWDNAYSGSTTMVMPEELAAAIKANKKAQKTFDTLSSQNRYALAFRLGNIKTEATRAKRIADYVAMLARGETIHPNTKQAAKTAKQAAATTKQSAATTKQAAATSKK